MGEIEIFCVHFLENGADDLYEIQSVTTTCWLVAASAKFSFHK